MTLRIRVFSWLAILVLSVLAVSVSAQERILRYDVDITANADASLDIHEDVTVDVEGRQIRRGIYRDVPARYRDARGDPVSVALEVLGVERDGSPEPWFVEDIDGGVRINTGNDDLLAGVPARFRYTIRYRTTGQLGFLAEHDQLFWNAIGTGWAFAIESADVRVRLPRALPEAQLLVEGFTGPEGSRGQAFEAAVEAPGVVHWRLTEPLAPGDGLTIALAFPKGVVTPPAGAAVKQKTQ